MAGPSWVGLRCLARGQLITEVAVKQALQALSNIHFVTEEMSSFKGPFVNIFTATILIAKETKVEGGE